MPGGERDQVGEALERDGVAVVHELRDGVLEGRDGAHRPALDLFA